MINNVPVCVLVRIKSHTSNHCFFDSRCKITAFIPYIGVLFPRIIGLTSKKCTFFAFFGRIMLFDVGVDFEETV